MSFLRLDLTSINAADEKGSESVFRKPKLFKAREEEGVISLADKSGHVRRIPKDIFNKTFVRWTEDGHSGYCVKPKKSYALKIKSQFSILEEDYDGEAITKIGFPGDYLITRESGMNEVCKKEEFEKKFVRSGEMTQENNKAFEADEMTM